MGEKTKSSKLNIAAGVLFIAYTVLSLVMPEITGLGLTWREIIMPLPVAAIGIIFIMKKIRKALPITSIISCAVSLIVSIEFMPEIIHSSFFVCLVMIIFCAVARRKGNSFLKKMWFDVGILSVVWFIVDIIYIFTSAEYRILCCIIPDSVLIAAVFIGWKWIADNVFFEKEQPAGENEPEQPVAGVQQTVNTPQSVSAPVYSPAPQQGRIVGYNTQTGAPIYEAPAVSQNGRIIGYDPHTGAPIYETPSPSQGRIVGYNTQTGAPIYENQANITQKKIIGYDPHTGAPIYG